MQRKPKSKQDRAEPKEKNMKKKNDDVQPDVHTDVEPDVHANVQPDVHTDVWPNFIVDIQADASQAKNNVDVNNNITASQSDSWTTSPIT
ncbi:hypothetical protein RYX36_022544 [Vicia faba]